MQVPIFQFDAFTARRFGGNPAAVMPLPGFLANDVLQAIAEENNLSETAFLVPHEAGSGDYRLRWFTPAVEVPLCGHATLASAAALMERIEPGRESVVFHTASGPLRVRRNGSGYVMDFPARPSQKIAVPQALQAALGVAPVEVLLDQHNYLVVLADAGAVREFVPDFTVIAALDRDGLIVTAPGDAGYDMVSRYFAPAKGIAEDPVTGGAHCALAPYWSARLNKNELCAFQASRRGGELLLRMKGERVELEGQCVFYMEGTVQL